MSAPDPARLARVAAFFDEVLEPEGTLDEVIEAAHIEAWEHMQSKWARP